MSPQLNLTAHRDGPRRRRPNWLLVALLVLTVAGFGGAPEVTAAEGFSHDIWTTTLERFVDDQGLVDYQGLAQDRATLDEYLAAIRERSPRSDPGSFPSREDELAYWINAYNALTFQGVLARGPETESVWTGGFFSGRAFFVVRKFVVGGETINLKKLEDDWIRAVYQDPRIHAALNCASLGCPRLPREAFVPGRLEEQLDAAMSEFVSKEQNVSLRDDGTVVLSKIFDWFSEDFLDEQRRRGVAEPSLVGYVNRYREAGDQLPAGAPVEFAEYDKTLNNQGR